MTIRRWHLFAASTLFIIVGMVAHDLISDPGGQFALMFFAYWGGMIAEQGRKL